MSRSARLIQQLDGFSTLRTRMFWLVGLQGSGKTRLLREVENLRPECEYLNLNLALALRLVEEVPAQRAFSAGRHLAGILCERDRGAWLVDNIELLFSRDLHLQVVDRLKSIALRVSLVVAWPGRLENHKLTYGSRDHPDFQRYPLDPPLYTDLNDTNHQDS